MDDDQSESLKIYFDEESWEALSAYEKERFLRLKRNYEFLKSTGLNAKLPHFMEPNKKLEAKTNLETRPKKGDLVTQGNTNLTKEELWKKRLRMDWGDPVVKVTPMAKRVFSSFLENALSTLEFIDHVDSSTTHDSHEFTDNELPKTGEEDTSTDDSSSLDGESRERYPKRNIARICYTEEEISREACEECGRVYSGQCPVHGALTRVLDEKVLRARRTCPTFLSVRRSSIEDTGLGIWTEVALPEGFVFGPYEGKIVKEQKEAQQSGYAWEVRKRGRVFHYVEGSDSSVSNWLRFVNCAPCEERQNLVAFQYGSNIYYKTYKPVPAFAELLVWYGGGSFPKDLGRVLTSDSETDNFQTDDKHILSRSDPRFNSCLNLYDNTKQMTKIETPAIDLKEQRSSYCIHNEPTKIGANFEKQSTDAQRPLQKAEANDTKENPMPSPDANSGLTIQAGRKSDIEEGQKPYSCLHYDFPLKYSHNGPKNAKTVHQSAKSHECPLCEYKAAYSTIIRTHIRAVHLRLKPHKCSLCGYRSSQSNHIRTHMQAVHQKLKPNKCPQCDYRTAKLTNIREHIKSVHQGLKSHKCPHCQYGTSRAADLRRHVKAVHEELKPYKCPHCDHRASRSTLLRKHVQAVHLRLKPHNCPYCGYRTTQSTDIRIHVQAVHLRLKPHKCPFCEHRAARSTSIRRHVKAVHEGLKRDSSARKTD